MDLPNEYYTHKWWNEKRGWWLVWRRDSCETCNGHVRASDDLQVTERIETFGDTLTEVRFPDAEEYFSEESGICACNDCLG